MSSYPKVYNVGHPQLDGFFDGGEIEVEEKVDGSQFSFGMIDGELVMRSKRAPIYSANPGMFAAALETVARIVEEDKLVPGWMYRCEYVSKPKHNVLVYDRVPKDALVLFDVDVGTERYLERPAIEGAAASLGLEAVPSLYVGPIDNVAAVQNLMETVSFLGGPKVEGLVFKRRGDRAIFGRDSKPMIAKYVSKAFREKHAKTSYRPQRADILEQIVQAHKTEARWMKAIQHLRESGELTMSPKDIGALMRDVQTDIDTECREEIADLLYRHFRKHILRGCTRGLAEWYKDWLLGQQFGGSDGEVQDNSPSDGREHGDD